MCICDHSPVGKPTECKPNKMACHSKKNKQTNKQLVTMLVECASSKTGLHHHTSSLHGGIVGTTPLWTAHSPFILLTQVWQLKFGQTKEELMSISCVSWPKQVLYDCCCSDIMDSFLQFAHEDLITQSEQWDVKIGLPLQLQEAFIWALIWGAVNLS